MFYSYRISVVFNPILTIYLLSFFLIFNVDNLYSQEKFKIVIDAGHGGKDPGKPTEFGFTEKEIVLKIALNLGALLEKARVIQVIDEEKRCYKTL